MDVKVIPITQTYRDNYQQIFGVKCPRCMDTGRIVYGPDTEGGRKSATCLCVVRKVQNEKGH
jgi:hypothetical protein